MRKKIGTSIYIQRINTLTKKAFKTSKRIR